MPTDEITTKEAMEILGYLHRSSIHRLVQAGKLEPSNSIFGAYLFLRQDVQALRATRTSS